MVKTTIKLDASALSKAACSYRYKLMVIDGFTDKVVYNDTWYGTCFHKFIALMYETGGDFSVAINEAVSKFTNTQKVIRNGKNHLNEQHLTKTCIDYWQYFQSKDNFQVLSQDGKPMVEDDFCIKVHDDDTLVIELVGTVDKRGQFVGGCYAIGDYKTHSLWSVSKNGNPKAAIEAYFKQFELSSQLRFYTYITKLLAKQYPDSVYAEFAKHQFGAFIDGVFLSSDRPTHFERSKIFFFSERDMEYYHRMLSKMIEKIIWLFYNPDYDMPDGIIVGLCNEGKFPCQFQNVCLQKDDAIRKLILKNEFQQKPYNPLMFSK